MTNNITEFHGNISTDIIGHSKHLVITCLLLQRKMLIAEQEMYHIHSSDQRNTNIIMCEIKCNKMTTVGANETSMPAPKGLPHGNNIIPRLKYSNRAVSLIKGLQTKNQYPLNNLQTIFMCWGKSNQENTIVAANFVHSLK